jgi:hypothetical protein
MLLLAPDKETDARPAKAVLRRGPWGSAGGLTDIYLERKRNRSHEPYVVSLDEDTAALAAVLTDTAALSHDRLPSERSRPTRLPAPRADRARHTASWRRAERADGCDGARCRRWTLQHRADTAALSHDRLPSDRSRPTRPGLSSPPACLRPAPQGPGERMRVRSTGAAAALGVAPRGAPRCCRPHQSVRSTLEPSPCRRAPLPTRTRSSAIACLAAAAVAVRASLRCRNGLWHALASAVPPLLGSVDGSYTSEHSR